MPYAKTCRVVATTLIVFALVTSCGALTPDKDDGAGDAPIDHGLNEPWIVFNAPDGYANVAWRCFKGNGIYVTRGATDATVRQLQIVPSDPACPPAPAG